MLPHVVYCSCKDPFQKAKPAAIELILEIYFSMLTELPFMATGETKRTAADKEKWIVLERLLDMMAKLT